jgi:hypothetical protein
LAGTQTILEQQQEAMKNYEKAGEIYLKIAETRNDDSYREFYQTKIKPEIDKIEK